MADADDRLRVLVLTAGMGGGHTQIARELRRRLVERGHDVVLADLLDLMPPPTGAWLGRTYPWLVERAPWLYDRVYEVFFLARQRAGERVGLPVRLALPGLRRLVRRFAPHAVVSTYHLAALAAGRLRERGELAAPAVTLITQWAVHDLWIHPAADLELTICAPAAVEARRRSGRPARSVGPVVRPDFAAVPLPGAVERTRHELGLRPDRRAALVVTGSMGLAGSAERAVAAVAGHGGWTPVVVAGRNERLRERLARHPGAVVLGWVDDMPSVMAACDVLVDNACGTTAKEALRLGLPVVTFRPIAGHGRDDARSLAALGLTDLVEDETALPDALDRLTADPAGRADRVARGRALFTGDAAAEVARLARAYARSTTGAS
ncbi:MAG TPA: glycosyltransferase [Pseudonocardia sp.]|nr:glycosyltransferase [Pseudonocardia sp.]